MKNQPRNFAFIDSQNLNLAIRGLGWNLDFGRFYVHLKDKYKVSKAFIFIGFIAGNEALYENLKKAGFNLIFKPTLERKEEGETITKGNVDAELVLHAMIEYPHYDKAMVVSGDGDFFCLIEYLEKMGKLSHVLIPNPQKFSALLRPFRKYFISIQSLRGKLTYRGKQDQKKPVAQKTDQKSVQKNDQKPNQPNQKKRRHRRHRNTKKRGSNLRTEP